MKIPQFPESNHELIRALSPLSDQTLVELFQRHPDSGKYFTAIFCRYSPIVYTLIRHSAKSPVQADYLFALTWRHILHELGGLEIPALSSATPQQPAFSLQNWLINITALCINQAVLPPVESIHYSLAEASPPLWCYIELALDRLHPTQRLIVVMAQTFRWSETRIAAYLQAEGKRITPAQVRSRRRRACQELEAALPEDIQEIYLASEPQSEETPAESADLMPAL
ncbi:MAG: sigma-70 family RNA polymerase sigma factor [Leptolyngbya sp. SIO4C5]|nr:sigma-70 family RNA polymerase sigma factor [Leptolyngbya sp. SIO4C5]